MGNLYPTLMQVIHVSYIHIRKIIHPIYETA